MKTASFVAVLALLSAGAAYAQPWQGPPGYGPHFWDGAPHSPGQRIEFFEHRINQAVRNGSLSQDERNRVSQELSDLRFMERHMITHDNGHMTPDHVALLQHRLDDVGQQIHWEQQRR